MPRRDRAILKKVSVSLPFNLGTAEWESDPTERRAAWSLYVEMVTRIAVQQRGSTGGSAREALNSLYKLFDITREILREAGPGVGASHNSAGGVAIAVLNQGLRPFMDVWHTRLQAWEEQPLPDGISAWEHKQAWPEEPQFREDLEMLRQELEQYAHALAVIAGVKE